MICIKANILIFALLETIIKFCIMKRRDIKKDINSLCGDLFAECVALIQYKKDTNKNDVENVMLTILQMQNDMISRLSHVEPGSTKLFFRKLREDLLARTEDIVEQIKAGCLGIANISEFDSKNGKTVSIEFVDLEPEELPFE